MMGDEVVAESSQVESNNISTGFLEKGMLHILAFLVTRLVKSTNSFKCGVFIITSAKVCFCGCCCWKTECVIL